MSKLYFISEELVNFLGIEKNTQMSLGSILIIIRDYILKNNLQDKKKTYKINPNDKLAKLLNLKETDELTYLNLTKYVTHLLVEKPKKITRFKKHSNKINLENDSSDDEKSSYAKVHPL
jgi:chromatin remodeling complex protein RSC6